MNQFIRPPATVSKEDTDVPKAFHSKRSGSRRSKSALRTVFVLLSALIIATLASFFAISFFAQMRWPSKVDDTQDAPKRGATLPTSTEESHGSTLQEVLDSIRNEPYEIFVTFDSYGNKLFEYTDHDPKKVEIPEYLLNYYRENNGAYIAHNHPLSYAAYSFDDLRTACKFEAAASIIATSEGDLYLQPTENGWPQDDLLLLWQQAHSSSVASHLWVTTETVDRDTGTVHRSMTTTDQLIQLFADDFDLVFFRVEPGTAVIELESDNIAEIIAPH